MRHHSQVIIFLQACQTNAFTIFVLFSFVSLSFTGGAVAQISSGGTPLSWPKAETTELESVELPPVDRLALLREDSLESDQDMPMRFGFAHEVNFNLTNSGQWEQLADGSRIWRLKVYCPNAYSINIIYDHYWLPDGAKLHIYSEDRSMVIGAFTSQNNKEYLKFSTAPVKGDVSILEYYEPAGVRTPGVISLSRIVHAYRNLFDRKTIEINGFGSSGPCNVNVNCSEGALWEKEKRAVVMTILWTGTRLCSGVLVNNAREDFTSYILTASHCLGSNATWIVLFNYESPSCTNINGPTWMSISGTTLRANYVITDFALVELSVPPPDSFDVYYAGWSRVDTASHQSAGIHHPSGDIKKIAIDSNRVVSDFWGGGNPNTHWRVNNWEVGITEDGSDGSPLFNLDHHIVGQLQGGLSSCSVNGYDKYGKFAKSWFGPVGSGPTTRLSDWLDPDGTAIMWLDGRDPLGVSLSGAPSVGHIPLTASFTGSSQLPADTWTWDFGDGDSAFIQSPTHIYESTGAYDVTLRIESGSRVKWRTEYSLVVAVADTLFGNSVGGLPGEQIELIIEASNTTPVNIFTVPVEYGGVLPLVFDSSSVVGCRTDYFETVALTNFDLFNIRLTYRLQSSSAGTAPDLPPGAGPILKLYFTIESSAQIQDTTLVLLDGYSSNQPKFYSPLASYEPISVPATVTVNCCLQTRGNVNNDILDEIDISDLTYLVAYMFGGGPASPCSDEADVNGDSIQDIADLTYLVAFMFGGGPPPAPCF